MEEKNYWKVSPGEYGYLKDDFIENEHIALGANDIGDLKDLSDEDVVEKVKELYGEKARFYTQLLEFKNNFNIGDKVLIYGKSSILALGEINSDYRYDNQQIYHHIRKVKWEKKYDFHEYLITDLNNDLQKTLQKNRTIVKLTEEQWKEIVNNCPTIEEEVIEDTIQDEYSFNITKEIDLQDYLWYNLESLEKGLEPLYWELYAEKAGRIDVLAKDQENNLVVIETKAGLAEDSAVAQILRYMGWVKKKYPNYNNVRGIIVANDFTPRARYAANAVDDIKLINYKVSFNFEETQ